MIEKQAIQKRAVETSALVFISFEREKYESEDSRFKDAKSISKEKNVIR